jgi:hypothetical protein
VVVICLGPIVAARHGGRLGPLDCDGLADGEVEVTPGDEIAFRIAVGVFVLGLFIFATWKVVDWRADRRRARRVAAARAAIAERARVTAAWNEIVANYDIADEYRPRLAERAIEIPRTGEGEQA